MLNKTEIIAKLFKDKDLDFVIQNILIKNGDGRLFNDFKQELFLILLNKEDSYIISRYEKGTILFLIYRICTNQINSGTSPFYKKYKGQHFDNIDIQELPIEDEDYHSFDILKYCNENNILSWYESEILSIYYKLAEHKHKDEKSTLRGIEEEYGIDHVSIHLTVKKAINKIKKHIGKNYI